VFNSTFSTNMLQIIRSRWTMSVEQSSYWTSSSHTNSLRQFRQALKTHLFLNWVRRLVTLAF